MSRFGNHYREPENAIRNLYSTLLIAHTDNPDVHALIASNLAAKREKPFSQQYFTQCMIQNVKGVIYFYPDTSLQSGTG